MKKILIVLVLLPILGFGQSDTQDLKAINNYKYIVFDKIQGDGHVRTLRKTAFKELTQSGYNVIMSEEVAKGGDVELPSDLNKNPDLALYLIVHVLEDIWWGNETVSVYMYDSESNLVYKSVKKGQVVRESIVSCLSPLTNFRYKYKNR